ncbi:MAG: dihydroorotase [Micrococcales bacterium]|nr:dihydroorotase [Micrococcales bacterium]MBT5430812.1 dihydroorotase [Micrococcales bacterium]MBT7925836.1 dihydroorotase [Micrococcales bacterium]
MPTILKNLTLADGSRSDIRIESDTIVEMGTISGSGIDCDSLIGLPGFVDPHTHLREPGFEASETVLSGSRAAAAGGYTAVCAMANTLPVADTAEIVEAVLDAGVAAGYCQVQAIGAVTNGLAGKQLSEITQMHQSRANVTMFSDDGICVSDPALMQEALAKVKAFGGVIAQHAQDPARTEGAQMNAGPLAIELGLTGWPRLAEEDIIARDALLAEQTGSRLHICHLTTAGGVEVVRWAKQRGIAITAEVTPHHLLLTEDLVRSYDPVYKVNPPLRTEADNKALIAGVLDGTIDVLGTDHAPHSAEKKEAEWGHAAFGMLGLETAASILHQVLADTGSLTWQLFEQLISSRPAALTGLSDHGQLAVGRKANITVFNPHEDLAASSISQSLSSNNPYAGMVFKGRVQHTVYNGTFTVRDQKLQERK